MGCDIHVKIENEEHGTWWTMLDDLAMPRDYELFGYLAGVRCQRYPYLGPPRGLPGNSEEDWALNKYYGTDGHSHSWRTFKEFIEADPEFVKTQKKSLWFRVWKIIADSVGHDKCRLVFFFDS